jgi:PAS domain S-box-containing protein
MAWSALPDGYVEFLNRRCLDYTGLSLDEARGWGWNVAVHPDDLDALTDRWRALLASGKAGEMEARVRPHDGENRWFLFRAEPVRNAHGDIVRWYGANTDIEERKRAESYWLRNSEAWK